MDQRSSVDLVLHSGGGVNHGLHHRGVVDWAGNRQDWGNKWSRGSKSSQRGGSQWSWSSKSGRSQWSWGSKGSWSQWSWSSKGSWSQWSWGSHKRSSNWDGLGDGVNKPILVEVLGESLQRDWSQTTLSSDQISEGGSERSGHRAVIDIGGSTSQELGLSISLGLGLSLSLVETMYGLVAGARERPSVAGCVVRSVEVGVTVGGVVVQRISFRFCQAERGDNENSDLKKNIDKILMLI